MSTETQTAKIEVDASLHASALLDQLNRLGADEPQLVLDLQNGTIDLHLDCVGEMIGFLQFVPSVIHDQQKVPEVDDRPWLMTDCCTIVFPLYYLESLVNELKSANGLLW